MSGASLTVYSVVVAALVGGGSWLAVPAHRQQAREEYGLLSAKVQALEERLKKRVRARFQRADVDGDGYLSHEELMAVDETPEKSLYFGGLLEWPPTTHEELFAAVNVVLVAALAVYFLFFRSGPAPKLVGKAVVKVQVIGAKNLLNLHPLTDAQKNSEAKKEDSKRSSTHIAAYMIGRVGQEHYNTKTCPGTLNPQWNHEFPEFHVDYSKLDIKHQVLTVEAYHYDNVFQSTSLGIAKFDLHELARYDGHQERYTKTLEGGEHGEVAIVVTYKSLSAHRR